MSFSLVISSKEMVTTVGENFLMLIPLASVAKQKWVLLITMKYNKHTANDGISGLDLHTDSVKEGLCSNLQ